MRVKLVKTMQATVVALGVLGLQTALSIPAGADPSDPSCPLAMFFICKMVPVASDLDGDVDLTKQQPPVDVTAPAPDSLPPADICARGCV
jgi:hypothetical protein